MKQMEKKKLHGKTLGSLQSCAPWLYAEFFERGANATVISLGEDVNQINICFL